MRVLYTNDCFLLVFGLAAAVVASIAVKCGAVVGAVAAIQTGVGATVHSVLVIYCKWLNALRIKFMIS